MSDRFITSPDGDRFSLTEPPAKRTHNELARGAWKRKTRGSVRRVDDNGVVTDHLQVPTPAGPRPPTGASLTIFSAINPDGRLLSNEQNVRRTHHLVAELQRLGFAPRVVTLFERTGPWPLHWYEPAVAVTGVSTLDRTVICTAFAQVGCVRAGRHTLRFEAAWSRNLSRDVACATEVVAERPCPMSHSRVDDNGVCKDPGGPWVHASQQCSLLWSWARPWVRSLYGCDTSAPTSVPTPISNEGTAPTALVSVLREISGGRYDIVVADGGHGYLDNAVIGDLSTGETIHPSTLRRNT